MGGVGLLGGTPDGDIETQTNRPGAPEGDAGRDGGTETGAGIDSGRHGGAVADAGRAPESTRSTGPTGGSGASGPARGVTSETTMGSPGVSDGGASTSEIRSPLDDAGAGGRGGPGGAAEPITPSAGDAAARDGPGDTYCGNCAQFDYVRTDQGMRPYCGHYDELMDDMDACEQWTPR